MSGHTGDSIYLAEPHDMPWYACGKILRGLEDLAMDAKNQGLAPSEACRVWIANHVAVYEQRYAAGDRSRDLVWDIMSEVWDAAKAVEEWK